MYTLGSSRSRVNELQVLLMASVSLVYDAPYGVVKHRRIALVSEETRVVESRWPIEPSFVSLS